MHSRMRDTNLISRKGKALFIRVEVRLAHYKPLKSDSLKRFMYAIVIILPNDIFTVGTVLSFNYHGGARRFVIFYNYGNFTVILMIYRALFQIIRTPANKNK